MIPYEDQLIKADIIEEGNKDEIFAWCKVFRLLEPSKGRYRLIIATRPE